MGSKTFTFVVSMVVRDMTEAEFEEAGGLEHATDEHDSSPDGYAESVDTFDLLEVISGALDGGNPELFAGSDLYLVVESVSVTTED